MSTKRTLGSDEVRRSIEHLIQEGLKCTETEREINTSREKGVLGFSAMLTVFPIMISISEAIFGERVEVRKSIKCFATNMKDDNKWLVTSRSDRQKIKCDALTDIRNGLVHAISLPPEVRLTKDIAEAQECWEDNPDKYECIIGIENLINEIEKTAFRLAKDKRYSEKLFDPEGSKSFEPIDTGPPSIIRYDSHHSSGGGAS